MLMTPVAVAGLLTVLVSMLDANNSKNSDINSFLQQLFIEHLWLILWAEHLYCAYACILLRIIRDVVRRFARVGSDQD